MSLSRLPQSKLRQTGGTTGLDGTAREGWSHSLSPEMAFPRSASSTTVFEKLEEQNQQRKRLTLFTLKEARGYLMEKSLAEGEERKVQRGLIWGKISGGLENFR